MRRVTLTEYVNEALGQATYEFCPGTESWCAWIKALPGGWSQADTVEEARQELAEVIEGWLIRSLQRGDPFPELKGRTVGRVQVGERGAAITSIPTARRMWARLSKNSSWPSGLCRKKTGRNCKEGPQRCSMLGLPQASDWITTLRRVED